MVVGIGREQHLSHMLRLHVGRQTATWWGIEMKGAPLCKLLGPRQYLLVAGSGPKCENLHKFYGL